MDKEQSSWSGVPGDQRCECVDVNDGHPHIVGKDNQCRNVGTMTLFRVDMEDATGTAFCNLCGEDAMDSGLFTDALADSGDDGTCGSCGANIGPCDDYPWHYVDEDCRAVREPKQ